MIQLDKIGQFERQKGDGPFCFEAVVVIESFFIHININNVRPVSLMKNV